MRLSLAQLNPLVGDLKGNTKRILTACHEASRKGADLLLTPELSLWGYPPRDQLLQPSRQCLQEEALEALVQGLNALDHDLQLLVGAALPIRDGHRPDLHNAIVLVSRRGWRHVASKQLLPNYDVFDERRYFRPGGTSSLLELDGTRLGLTICEDLWVDAQLQRERLSGPDPIAALQDQRPDLLINLAASPFDASKGSLRRQLATKAAQRLNCPVVYLNQVGGNDELVFDGASFVISPQGSALVELPFGQEAMEIWDSRDQSARTEQPQASAGPPNPLELLFRALVLGVRDYAGKCGFRSCLLGLSGGIDSALVAVIAAAALGPDRVQALLMPSPWSSQGSIDDAAALARRLTIGTATVPIAALMEGFDTTLTPVLGGQPADVTAENLQSRIRGTLLMAMANQQGQLLLSTGNKSELAVGYCTLYGDMNGGLAVIGDLYKSTVFKLCDWLDSDASSACRQELGLLSRNALVGHEIRTKPPSAELRPDQKDSDSLPDYAVLDPLLKDLIEERYGREQLLDRGHPPSDIDRVLRLFQRSEFKRRQAAPLLKVSRQAFGTGWRLPIAAG